MGLYVVGRLAVRNGIRVELRSALSGGLTAFVLMPARVIVQGGDRGTGFTPRRFEISESPVQPAVPATAGALDSGPGPWGRQGGPSGPLTDPMPVVPDSGPQRIFEGTGPQPAVRDQGSWQPATSFQNPDMGAPPGRPPHAVPGAGQGAPPMPLSGESLFSPAAPAGPLPGAGTNGYEDAYGDGYAAPGQNGPSGGWERVESTGPIRREERLPIFDAIESEWFQRRSPGTDAPSPVPAWQSPGDEGWRVAEATTRAPKASGRTASGLPKRVPGKNRVPGSVTTSSPVAPPKSAEAMRSRFASFQQGVSRGRAAARSEDSGEIE
jgi:hypothetical protein